MKKLLIPFLFIGYALCTQSCKKSVSDSVISYPILQADINNAVWTPDTVSASVTYNTAANTRTFYCIGTYDQQQVTISVTQPGGNTSTGYPVGTYTLDATSNIVLTYYSQQKNSAGAYEYMPQGTVTPGSGRVTISSVDTVKKTITGSFSFTPTTKTFDAAGNLTSINVTNVDAGVFYALPYNFTRK